MKRIALFLAAALATVGVFAQNLNKNELKQLQAFLNEPAKEAATNAEALKITDLKAPATWEGITIANGHVTDIKWNDKKLGGALNLAGFSALQTVDVSRNAITSLTVANDAALTELNASRNKITEVNLSGCGALVKLNLNNNRISEFALEAVPFIKTINIASNNLVDLNLASSSTLEYLNCQSNRLENLSVSNCTSLKTLYC
ncbi:MAG: hypothetical protein K2M14_01205, partial [Muribaculaceae bacterium]|nr:hypothetical protein [Muribaculaceae bacterium]